MAAAVSAFTYVVTIVVDYGFSVKGYVSKESHIWTNLILPILPVILGSVGALIAKQYPFPAGITSGSGSGATTNLSGIVTTTELNTITNFIVKVYYIIRHYTPFADDFFRLFKARTNDFLQRIQFVS